MGRYTGPKDRLSRREGFDLFGKGAKLTRLNIPPGVHGPKGTRGPSQYGKQLREKQKVKRIYGVSEKQFRKYIVQALKSKGNTGNVLFSLLESRLDNTIYRLGFAATRPQARQMVSHRHVMVNGARVNIPSYQVHAGDTIVLAQKTIAIPKVTQLIKSEEVQIPGWLQRKSGVGKIVRVPTREDVSEPIADQDIIEFYSR
ncbi:30S ribosomal protein S4 [Candidatus Woesebacteria bacterium RIFCSPHIGHO2_01_FULL_41_10]|uniref:Small ribosomal subunit protein uS4 n=1 Tax=Candidatus Woesebacteria bacterium RIFCSPHIGHO2_01_FULL_41_10 TaxID=1802500 RepID=A0A1F7YTM7_9BACT|nr:MAG: 30S ribosomal protein S4 [Candidatus Woesebacteria bacterium RIFCSPHIGHO2_01_FULL_41_10]